MTSRLRSPTPRPSSLHSSAPMPVTAHWKSERANNCMPLSTTPSTPISAGRSPSRTTVCSCSLPLMGGELALQGSYDLELLGGIREGQPKPLLRNIEVSSRLRDGPSLAHPDDCLPLSLGQIDRRANPSTLLVVPRRHALTNVTAVGIDRPVQAVASTTATEWQQHSRLMPTPAPKPPTPLRTIRCSLPEESWSARPPPTPRRERDPSVPLAPRASSWQKHPRVTRPEHRSAICVK